MSDSNFSWGEEFDEQLWMQELGGDPQEAPGEKAGPAGQRQADTFKMTLRKKARVPKTTEDVIPGNDGSPDEGASSTTQHEQNVNPGQIKDPPQSEPPKPKRRGVKRKAKSGWLYAEDRNTTNIYVSGLPPDTTVDEFIQFMSKFGIILRDPETDEFKVKLYTDDQGNLSGDALCCYSKRESLQRVLTHLDEDHFRGHKLQAEVAAPQLVEEYEASSKKREEDKTQPEQQKQLDLSAEKKAGQPRMRHERVVILRNVFQRMDLEGDPMVLNEIRGDLRVECAKFGKIKKLTLFDKHPDSMASVRFRNPEDADDCVQNLDGRWFRGQKITAETWDGTTDYQVEETTRKREEESSKVMEACPPEPEANAGSGQLNLASTSKSARPSTRVRHFSEHPATSPMNVAGDMAPEGPGAEKKSEKPEEETSEEESKAGSIQEESEEESEESSSDTESSEGGFWERVSDEGDKEPGNNDAGKEPLKKKFRKCYPENRLRNKSDQDGAEKGSEDKNDPPKESEADLEKEEEHSPANQEAADSENDEEEEDLEMEIDEDECVKELKKILEKELQDLENAELEDDSSDKELDEESSETEFKEVEEKTEEDGDDNVFDDKAGEKEDEDQADAKGPEDAGDQEEDEAGGMLSEDSEEKKDEEDTAGNVLGDAELFDENPDEKSFLSYPENPQEEAPVSIGSSFVLSSDDDDI
ncbi:HIV Tat-specific factor 1 [Echinops telfairi]|uniref:HIV Tat-specific factor 1 n=1 Tax=Echinops telfairi TaxID=9371 RepID=A0ABM0J2L8_ECHTE|nr:HIV Tat-specific factor 1 [Echinops telfairi]